MISTGTRNGVLLGAAAGLLVTTVGVAAHPALTVCSAATLGAAIGIRRGRATPNDLFVLRILLAGCLGALAAIGVGVFGAVPSIVIGLIAVLIVVGGVNDAIHFSRAERRRARIRAQRK